MGDATTNLTAEKTHDFGSNEQKKTIPDTREEVSK